METKKCTKCGDDKAIELFSWKNKKTGERHSNCKACVKETVNRHYNANKQLYKDRATVHNKKQRESHYRNVLEHLEKHPCVDCGEDDPIVLQFDHVRGKKKDDIAHMVTGAYSWKTIKAEIDKCEVRCANCHTRRTARQFGWKYKTGSFGSVA